MIANETKNSSPATDNKVTPPHVDAVSACDSVNSLHIRYASRQYIPKTDDANLWPQQINCVMNVVCCLSSFVTIPTLISA